MKIEVQDTKNSEILRSVLLNNYAACGFAALGVACFELHESDRDHLRQWLTRGCHGNMGYMERWGESRHDLRRVFPEVRSVIVVLMPFARVKPHVPFVAAFAHAFRDYHVEVRAGLLRLHEALRRYDPTIRARAVVDSAPVFERAWAVRASLGWIGRSSMLIHPELGSSAIIGILLVDRDITPDERIVPDGCAEGCRLCIEACPGRAILEDRTIDARRCLSYLTVESDPGEASTGGHILGCDTCVDVCPWNRSVERIEPRFTHVDWCALTPEQFDVQFGGSSFERVGLERIKRLLKPE